MVDFNSVLIRFQFSGSLGKSFSNRGMLKGRSIMYGMLRLRAASRKSVSAPSAADDTKVSESFCWRRVWSKEWRAPYTRSLCLRTRWPVKPMWILCLLLADVNLKLVGTERDGLRGAGLFVFNRIRCAEHDG